jgi:hypothetical protein
MSVWSEEPRASERRHWLFVLKVSFSRTAVFSRELIKYLFHLPLEIEFKLL